MKHRTEILENGSIFRGLVYLAWPALALNIIQNFVSLADIFFVGKIGVQALSAVAIAGILFSTYWSIQGGFMGGGIALISRYSGRKDYFQMCKTLVNMICVSFLTAALYVGVMFLFLNDILSYFGAKGRTLELAVSFSGIMLFSFMLASVLFVSVISFRGAGANVAPLVYIGSALALNFLIDPVLIFGLFGLPVMGVKGAALAYIISISIPLAVLLVRFFTGRSAIKFFPEAVRIDFTIWKKYLAIAIPAMAQGVIANVTALIMLRIASAYGDTFIAAFGIGGRLDVFVMFFCWSIGSSVSIMVGHNLGAKKHGRPEGSVITGLKMVSIITASASVVFFIFAPYIIRAFNSDAAVVNYGSMYLKFVSPAYILMGAGIIFAMAFNGAGSTRIAMIINAVAFFLFQVPLAYILSVKTPLAEKGIFIGVAAAFAVQGIAGFLIYKKGKWINHEL